MIDGNQNLRIQIMDSTTTNEIGEPVPAWKTVQSIWGWLDMTGGDSKYTYNAKIQESTHVCVADYVPLAEGVKAENSRAIDEDGLVYDVLYFDDPMKLHEQWEIYMKFTGGQ
jgi:SPP1 family predicted phage head-tail adaptor